MSMIFAGTINSVKFMVYEDEYVSWKRYNIQPLTKWLYENKFWENKSSKVTSLVCENDMMFSSTQGILKPAFTTILESAGSHSLSLVTMLLAGASLNWIEILQCFGKRCEKKS